MALRSARGRHYFLKLGSDYLRRNEPTMNRQFQYTDKRKRSHLVQVSEYDYTHFLLTIDGLALGPFAKCDRTPEAKARDLIDGTDAQPK
jgi:hypothetical protein